ncbi:MAG TPA: exodeoxyribonuclease V subunit gamma [Polyangia bacterium]|nr:exodeoxyribonuclease V subunit gamma [Polyangia bacterium]
MIRVCHSNRIEELLAVLDDALPPAGALFDSPWLVVPSRPLEHYLDLDLARRRGVFGNIDTLSLNAVYARLCAAATQDVVLLDRLHVVGELLALLEEPRTGRAKDPALAPIDDYLLAAGSAPDVVARRRVDVARGVAALFSDWSDTRPEWLAAWRAGGSVDQSRDARLLAAEQRLWQLLFAPDGRFARRGRAEGKRYLTLDAALDAGLDSTWAPPAAIHLFGMTELPRGQMRGLERLGGRTALTIYAYNPCREFWEDVETRRRRAAPAARKTGAAKRGRSDRQLELGLVSDAPVAAPTPDAAGEREHDNPFLALWGGPGRDTARWLDQLCDGNAEVRSRPSDDAGTLLARVQRDILDREPRRTGARALRLPADGSLTVARAANPRREWETVAARIWRHMRDDARDDASTPPLRFCDIAVLIAGPDEPYLSLAPSVFREASQLPYTIVDEPLAASSRIPEVILALLALPMGPLARGEVLDVLTHPNVRARFADVDPARWVALCDALGIARGADRDAFRDTYLDRDRFNWDQGLTRLALGRFMAGAAGSAEDAVIVGQTDTPRLPAELTPDFRDDADALALLARSLLADVAFARDARLTIADWVRFIHALFDAYVVPLSPDDEAARLQVFAALESLMAASRPETRVSLTVARELVTDVLGGLRGQGGQIFGNGVVIGSLRRLRALPFRHVFVVGLGPDRFPAADRALPLDPGGRGQAGDLTPLQRDRYAFLQALLAARDGLQLSYVDRDPHTGDPRDPSSVLLELQQTLAEGYAAPATWERTTPLERADDPDVCAAFPVAAAEAEARRQGDALLARFPEAARLDEGALRQALSPAARTVLHPLLATVPVAAPAATPARPRIIVRLHELRRFLECPLQGGAALSLRLRSLGDDTEVRETTDEPFDAPGGLAHGVLADLFVRAWTTETVPTLAQLADAYDRAAAGARLSRVLPAGIFGDAARLHHMALLESWRQALTGEAATCRGPAEEPAFGRPEPQSRTPRLHPALTLPIALPGADAPVSVELRGHLAPRVIGPNGVTSLILGPELRVNDRDFLRLFLDHVVLAAAGTTAPEEFRGFSCREQSKGPSVIRFAAVAAERARDYLTALLTDALAGANDLFLPHEAVFRARKAEEKGENQDLLDCILQMRDDTYYRNKITTNFGPVPQPLTYPLPSLETATAIVERRFGLFFELRAEPAPRKKS